MRTKRKQTSKVFDIGNLPIVHNTILLQNGDDYISAEPLGFSILNGEIYRHWLLVLHTGKASNTILAKFSVEAAKSFTATELLKENSLVLKCSKQILSEYVQEIKNKKNNETIH